MPVPITLEDLNNRLDGFEVTIDGIENAIEGLSGDLEAIRKELKSLTRAVMFLSFLALPAIGAAIYHGW